MLNKTKVTKYFEDGALSWISDQYEKQNYSYPVAINRYRITLNVIGKEFKRKKLNILNIGCGNAALEVALAKMGHRVTSVDISIKMLDIAQKIAKKREFIKK